MKTKFTLVAVAFAMLLGSCAKAPEKTYLFNGKDLNNWVFALENNSVLTTDVYKINKAYTSYQEIYLNKEGV